MTLKPLVSIIILTYNAPKYVYKTLLSLQKTSYENYEVIVFDNNSRLKTKLINLYFQSRGQIKKLILSDKNLLFAKGNNQAFSNISKNSKYVVLLNSDVLIKDPDWLTNLLKIHQYGATAFGSVLSEPIRADGYCFLTDTELYEKYKLDENYEWWWGLTKYQAQIMEKENATVKAVSNHNTQIYHFGGASRKGYDALDSQNALGLDIDINEVKSWFINNKVEIIENY